jgi:hypothetical protein
MQLQIEIYRKPSGINILIHHNSCHPGKHKMAEINYLMNRVNTYPILVHSKEIELQKT